MVKMGVTCVRVHVCVGSPIFLSAVSNMSLTSKVMFLTLSLSLVTHITTDPSLSFTATESLSSSTVTTEQRNYIL